MNDSKKGNGLPARQKTSTTTKGRVFGGRHLWICLVLVSFLLSSCHEQTNGQAKNNDTKKSEAVTRDSVNQPHVNITVKKHYDDKGNVVGVDSTYTSRYSNIEGDTSHLDSLMKRFDSFFSGDRSLFFGRDFRSKFFDDSLGNSDFSRNDFFKRRFELNDSYFRDMMDKMDSIKNQFYRRYDESRDL